LFGFPLPWSEITPQNYQRISGGTRNILSMNQYTISLLAFPEQIFLGSIFWFGLLVALVFIVFGVIGIIAIISGSDELKNVVKNRLIYTLVRVTLFAYFPLVVWTMFTFTIGTAATTGIAIAIVFLVIIIPGFPIIIFWILPRDKQKAEKLFAPNFMRKFGPLYNSFFFKRTWFMVIQLGKKLALGIIIGVLYNQQIAQLVLILVILLTYSVVTFLLKPYLDHVHTFVDVVVTIGNIVVTSCMFVFLDGVADDLIRTVFAGITAGFLLLSQVVCIGAFFHSWLRMRNVTTFREFLDCVKRKKSSRKTEESDIELPTTKID